MAGAEASPGGQSGQRTLRNALIALVLLLIGMGVTGYACTGTTVAPPALDRYIRLGPRLGPPELERDLARDVPVGTGTGAFFAHLTRLGFDCTGALEAGRGGECRFRTRRDDGRMVNIAVSVTHDGVVVRSISAQMTLSP